jgi:hypothetical protein
MDEMTQPQVVQTANQPEHTAAMSGAETRESAPETPEPMRSGTTEQPFLTVRYNKQDKPLSREEAAVYAQKGMNYDKLMGRLKAAEEQVKTLGGGREAAAEQSAGEAKSGALAGDQRVTLQGGARDVQAVVNAQLNEFVAAHPDVDPAGLPGSVLGAWKRGVPLSEAYGAYRAREEQQLERARTANAVNAAASMGGAGAMGAATPQPLTDEAIQAMSPAELDKNHGRIWAYLTGQKS